MSGMPEAQKDRTKAMLWRASFIAPAHAMPGMLEALEELASSVSIFEDEVDLNQETASWRVDLLFAERPKERALHKTLCEICAAYRFVPGKPILEPVLEEDWVAASTMRTPPTRVGRFWLYGPHVLADLPPDLVPIQMEAGLAFGSGDHATTQACLEALDEIARTLRYHCVLDMGCGSAVLAIAAAKCRPCRAVAVDNDPVAVRVAQENAVLNNVARRVSCVVSEGYSSSAIRRKGPYDLVFSNILADPLIAMAGDLSRNLASGGIAVLSGFLARHVDAVAEAHRRYGLRVRREIAKGPWAALVLEAPRRPRRPLIARNAIMRSQI